MKYDGNIEPILKSMEHIKIDYDISNTNIADRMGKSKQTISNIFKGRQPNMTLDSLKALCDAMDCDLVIDIVRRD